MSQTNAPSYKYAVYLQLCSESGISSPDNLPAVGGYGGLGRKQQHLGQALKWSSWDLPSLLDSLVIMKSPQADAWYKPGVECQSNLLKILLLLICI